LSQAAGYAYALQYLDGDPTRQVYVMMGDGELDEGNIWEAAMFAAKYRLGRLIGFVDRNYIQIDGNTEDVMPLDDLGAKWASFGWQVQVIDGHDIDAILGAVAAAQAEPDQPSVIIACTTPGKGVSFIEDDYLWHGKPPTPSQAEQALAELTAEARTLP
jgi:transketolase